MGNKDPVRFLNHASSDAIRTAPQIVLSVKRDLQRKADAAAMVYSDHRGGA